MRLPKVLHQPSLGMLRGSTFLVVLSAVAAGTFSLNATPSLSKRSAPNPFPGLIDIRSNSLTTGNIANQGTPAASSEEVSPDRAAGEVESETAGNQPRSAGWRWEKVILFHFTNPASRPGIAASRAGQRLSREFDSSLNLLAESLSSDDRAAPRQESLAGLGEDRAGFEDVPLNALPEPPPLVLFATGLACVFLSRAVRRLRKSN